MELVLSNVDAHGDVGQQGSTLPFLSIGIGSMVISVALLTCTAPPLVFVDVPLHLLSCEYFKLGKHSVYATYNVVIVLHFKT